MSGFWHRERILEPARTDADTVDPTIVRRSNQPWCRPQGSRVVDVDALESIDRAAQVREAGFVDRPHLSFRRAMPAALGALHDAGDVFINRVGRHEDHLGCEAPS